MTLLDIKTPNPELLNIQTALGKPRYSGDPKSDLSKSGDICNRDYFKIGHQMVWFSKGLALATAKVPTI